MAGGINLASAYVSLHVSTKGMAGEVNRAMAAAGKSARKSFDAAFGAGGKSVDVDADTGVAAARLAAIRSQAEGLASMSPSIKVDADTAGAASGLAAVQSQAAAVGAMSPTVKVDADTAGAQAGIAAVGAASVSSSAGVSGLVAAGLALGPALIPAAGAATAAIAGLGGAAAASAAGIGVAALAFSGIGDAIKDSVSAEGAAAQDSAAASARRVMAARQVESAQQSLGDAVRSQAAASVQSARAVRDAQSGVSDARLAAADGVKSALGRVRAAEESQTSAVRASKSAQDALTDARVAARRGLQELQDQLRDGQLSERQAALSLRRARAELAKGGGSALDQDQAQLDYDRAKANLADIRSDNKQLAADKKKADREGIAGSDQVVAAQQRVTDARAREKKAGQDVAAAEAGVSKARADGAKRVADAQLKLSDAVSAQAASSERSSLAVARAQRDVSRAQSDAAKASDKSSASASKAAASMAALSPAGRKFATYILGLRGTLGGLQRDAAKGFLPGLQKGMQAAGRALAPFKGQIGAFARELGKLATQAGKGLGGPAFQDFFRMVGREGPKTLGATGRIIGNLAKAFAGLAVAFSPVSKQVLGGLEKLTARFAAFANEGEGGGLSRFVAYVQQMGPKVAAMLGAVGRAFGAIMVAMAPWGAFVVGAITKLSNGIAALPVGVLRALMGAVIGLTLAWKAATLVARTHASVVGVMGVAKRLSTLWTNRETAATVRSTIATKAKTVATKAAAVAQRLMNLAMRMNPIGMVITALLLLGAGMVLAYKKSETFRRIVNAAWAGIKKAASATVTWFKTVAWPWMKAAFTNIANAAKWLWQKGIKPAFDGIKAVISWWYKNVVKRYFALVRAIFRGAAATAKWLWQKGFKPAFRGIAAVATWLWKKVKSTFAFMKRGFQGMAAVAKWLWGKIKAYFRGISATTTWLWGKVKATFGFMKRGFQGIAAVAKWLWGKIKAHFGRIADNAKWLWGKVKWAFDKMKAGVRAVKDAFGTAAKGLRTAWAKVNGYIRTPIRKALKWMNDKFIGGINKLLSTKILSIPKTWRIPEIKGFAGGGYTGAGSKYQPAGVVHADEFVVQKSSRRKFERDNPGALDHLNRTGSMPGYAIGGKVAGLNTRFKKMLDQFNAAAGNRYSVNSGYRSNAKQKVLYNRYLAGNGPVAAKPGSSMHNRGLAADLAPSDARNVHGGLAKSMGLVFTVPSESWHIEPSWGRGSNAGPSGGGGGGFGLPSWLSNPIKWLKDKVAGITKPFKDRASQYGVAGKALPAVFNKLRDVAGDKIKKAADSLMSFGSGGGNMDWSAIKAGPNKMLGKQMAAKYGWTGGNWSALSRLWDKESNWNHRAKNPSSGAYGIPQSLPASKMASRSQGGGPDYLTNPKTQISWGLKYIKQRYGNPAKALAFHGIKNWYADGADSASRGWSVVGEQGPELVNFSGGQQVYNRDQTMRLAKLASAPDVAGQSQGFSGPVVVNVIDRDGSFVERMRGEIDMAGRHSATRARMGAGGRF